MGQIKNQQCQSTKGNIGLKDQASIPPGPPYHVTIIQHITNTNTHTQNTHTHK